MYPPRPVPFGRRHFAGLAALAFAAGHVVAAAPPATTQPMVHPDPAYWTAMHAIYDSVGNMADLRDPAYRARVRPGLVKAFATYRPLEEAYHQRRVAAGLATDPTAPQAAARQAACADLFFRVLLLAVDDPDTHARVEAETTSPDPQVSLVGRCKVALADLLTAPTAAGQAQALARLDGLLKAAPADSRQGDFSKVFGALMDVSIVMADPVADRAAGVFDAYAPPAFAQGYAAERFAARYVGKPIVLAGRTVDGVDLSTAEQYKGKVVLVDFWASWCGPCKAELPRVKAMYAKYHDQGFEVLGISNDYRRDALVKYLAANPLPWPSLFSPEAAAEHKWHPLTRQYKIEGIPKMFLIDRAGVLRTVQARTEMETLVPRLLAESQTGRVSMAAPQ